MSTFGYKDQVHGYIQLPVYLKKFIDVPEFQRLENIKQLGPVHKVYRGAKHDRLSHSIGTSFLANKMAREIKLRYPELNVKDHEVFLVTIAGLYHDIGHGPFSHLFETFMNSRSTQKWDHEEIGCTIIQTRLFHLFESKDDLETVIAMIKGKYNETEKTKHPNREFLFQIVHNEETGIDVDKCDYYLRDSYNAGIKINYNAERLLSCFLIKDCKITYGTKEYHNVYEFFHTRNVLHATLYNHRVCWQIEAMVFKILEEGKELTDSLFLSDWLDKFLELDDSLINEIGRKCNSATWIRLQERDLYKTLIELHPRNQKQAEDIKKVISEEIQNAFGYTLVCKKIGFEESDHPLRKMNFVTKEGKSIKVDEKTALPRDHDVYIARLISSLQEKEYKEVKATLVQKLGVEQQIFY